MGGECSTYGRQERCLYGFGSDNLLKGIPYGSRWRSVMIEPNATHKEPLGRNANIRTTNDSISRSENQT